MTTTTARQMLDDMRKAQAEHGRDGAIGLGAMAEALVGMGWVRGDDEAVLRAFESIPQTWTQSQQDDDTWLCPCGASIPDGPDDGSTNGSHWNTHAAPIVAAYLRDQRPVFDNSAYFYPPFAATDYSGERGPMPSQEESA